MSKLKTALDHASYKTGLSHEEIMSDNRIRKYVNARYHVIRMLKDDFGLSYSMIGRLMKKDHSTIIHAYTRGIIPERIGYVKKINRVKHIIRPDYEKELVVCEEIH